MEAKAALGFPAIAKHHTTAYRLGEPFMLRTLRTGLAMSAAGSTLASPRLTIDDGTYPVRSVPVLRNFPLTTHASLVVATSMPAWEHEQPPVSQVLNGWSKK